MCHRQLRYDKYTECGHSVFMGELNVDCRSPTCYVSRMHPPDCGLDGRPKCVCRRFYTCVDNAHRPRVPLTRPIDNPNDCTET